MNGAPEQDLVRHVSIVDLSTDSPQKVEIEADASECVLGDPVAVQGWPAPLEEAESRISRLSSSGVRGGERRWSIA